LAKLWVNLLLESLLLKEQKLSRAILVYQGKSPTLEDGVAGFPLEQFLELLWRGEILR